MIHGSIQYSTVRPFARHHDGSFGTWREMEKTVERHFGLEAKNEDWRSRYCTQRDKEADGERQADVCVCECVHCISAFVYFSTSKLCVFVCACGWGSEKLLDRSVVCLKTCGGLQFHFRAVQHMAFNLIFHRVLSYTRACERKGETLRDSQVRGVFRDVWRYTGQFEIGAVDHGALAATFLWTHQILEALATQTAAVVLLTCRGERERGENKVTYSTRNGKNKNGGDEKSSKLSQWGRRR